LTEGKKRYCRLIVKLDNKSAKDETSWLPWQH
jgi:hypothetical protein